MNLQEFLNKSKSVKNITKKITVGDRFKDENGNDMPFEIKTITADRIGEIRDRNTTVTEKGVVKFNSGSFNTAVALACCIYPNFKDKESIEARGVRTPEQYMKDVLLPGEIDAICNEVQRLSGYNTKINDLIEEAKN